MSTLESGPLDGESVTRVSTACVSAVVDTTEEGRLEDAVLLKSFKEGGKFATFGEAG